MVLQASSGDSSAALENLCRTYWYPLYAYVRRQGYDATDAQDLTQGFFELFLSKHYLKDVDRDKGRFRSFLLASLKHFLANEWKKAGRQKRGGRVQTVSFDAMEAEEHYRHEPAEESSPELAYDCGWARTILKKVLTTPVPGMGVVAKAGIDALAAAPNGSLWIGTSKGLFRLDRGLLHRQAQLDAFLAA